jgi:hypothetical protein
MKSSSFLLLVVACALSMISAFAPKAQMVTPTTNFAQSSALTRMNLNIGEQERDKLTRDSEPADYFKT